MNDSTKLVGRAFKRVEDPRLIQGLGHFVDDIRLSGTLHIAFLRSPHAHAHLQRMDAGAAKSAPGVVTVLTGADIRDRIGPIPCACAGSLQGLRVPYHPVLAQNKVIFVGQPVAAVVAENLYAAHDAAQCIEVDYEPLDVVTDPEVTSHPKSPVIHEQYGDNVAFTVRMGIGDVDAAFAQADCVIEQRMVIPRLAPSAIEPRGVLASYHAGEESLTLWSSTQVPHLVRTYLAQMLRFPDHRLRVIAPEVGGAFGSKLNVFAEEAITAFLSIQLGRPVKWIESRRENMAATPHGRSQVGVVKVAARRDGALLGIRYDAIADLGAYMQLMTPAIPTATGMMLSGCYKIPAARMDLTGVFTNKMATDAYRGAGRPEATYLIERVVDMVARELRLDPAELRRRNFPRPDEFPFATATGLLYDSGNYDLPLRRALEMADYGKLREKQQALRAEGRLLGIGISTYVEISGVGPSGAVPIGGWDISTVHVLPNGGVTVITGISPHGQGEETAFTQIVADSLGVPPGQIVVTHGDTSRVPAGVGTFGSRGIAVGGSALVFALEKLKQKATQLAAHLFGVPATEVCFETGTFSAAGKSLSLTDVACAAHQGGNLPPGMEPGLSATQSFEPKNFTFPFGAHVCAVEVDAETGEIKILRFVAVDDCGRVINPLLVDGQIHGGIAQGIGQALCEEVVYDELGQLITGSFMDYAMPRASLFPWFETDRTETPTDVNPLGAKGVGESGALGATPAVVNAVVDALAPFGVKHIDVPLRPEKIWRLIREARERPGKPDPQEVTP